MDQNTPAFYGSATLHDYANKVVARFEDMVPAVIEFELPLDKSVFTITAGEKSYTQQLELVESEHDEDE